MPLCLDIHHICNLNWSTMVKRKILQKLDIIKELKTVYDPEMPSINVYDLGLIYKIDIAENEDVTITHTLTSMFCPAGDMISGNIRKAAERAVSGNVTVKLTHTPPFSKEMMSEEARMILNI